MNSLFNLNLTELLTSVEAPVYRLIDVNKIIPDPDQPRKEIDDNYIQELAASLQSEGQLQPIEVSETSDGHYMIVFGELRWRAAKKVGIESLQAKVVNVEIQKRKLRQLIENLQRKNMSPIDTANGIKNLVELLDGNAVSAANALGFSEAQVSKYLSVLDLPPNTKELAEQAITKDIETLTTLASIERKDQDAAKTIVAEAKKTGKLSRANVRELAKEVNEKAHQNKITTMSLDELSDYISSDNTKMKINVIDFLRLSKKESQDFVVLRDNALSNNVEWFRNNPEETLRITSLLVRKLERIK